MSKPLVIVDADTLLFSAASVAETKSIEVTHSPTGITKSFSNRTAFKDTMKARNKVITEDYIIKDIQDPEPVENCLQIVKQGIEGIYSMYSDCEIVLYAGDSDNFRLNLPLPYRYKSGRADVLRPVHLGDAHSYARGKYKAKKALSAEVDDEVIITAHRAMKAGRETILLSPDKDSRQCIGVKLGSYKTPRAELVVVPEYADVELIKDEPKSYGVSWIAVQMLLGDATDSYKPTDLTFGKVKYGAKGVYKDLVECKTPQESLLKVVDKYKEWYPKKFSYKAWDDSEYEVTWQDVLRLYYKCVKMKTTADDPLIADELFTKYGIDL